MDAEMEVDYSHDSSELIVKPACIPPYQIVHEHTDAILRAAWVWLRQTKSPTSSDSSQSLPFSASESAHCETGTLLRVKDHRWPFFREPNVPLLPVPIKTDGSLIINEYFTEENNESSFGLDVKRCPLFSKSCFYKDKMRDHVHKFHLPYFFSPILACFHCKTYIGRTGVRGKSICNGCSRTLHLLDEHENLWLDCMTGFLQAVTKHLGLSSLRQTLMYCQVNKIFTRLSDKAVFDGMNAMELRLLNKLEVHLGGTIPKRRTFNPPNVVSSLICWWNVLEILKYDHILAAQIPLFCERRSVYGKLLNPEDTVQIPIVSLSLTNDNEKNIQQKSNIRGGNEKSAQVKAQKIQQGKTQKYQQETNQKDEQNYKRNLKMEVKVPEQKKSWPFASSRHDPLLSCPIKVSGEPIKYMEKLKTKRMKLCVLLPDHCGYQSRRTCHIESSHLPYFFSPTRSCFNCKQFLGYRKVVAEEGESQDDKRCPLCRNHVLTETDIQLWLNFMTGFLWALTWHFGLTSLVETLRYCYDQKLYAVNYSQGNYRRTNLNHCVDRAENELLDKLEKHLTGRHITRLVSPPNCLSSLVYSRNVPEILKSDFILAAQIVHFNEQRTVDGVLLNPKDNEKYLTDHDLKSLDSQKGDVHKPCDPADQIQDFNLSPGPLGAKRNRRYRYKMAQKRKMEMQCTDNKKNKL